MNRQLIILISILMLPQISFAAFNKYSQVTDEAIKLLNKATPIVLGLILLIFFWGLAQVIFKAGNPTAVEAGKKVMRAGIFGLFIAMSVWGIVNILLNTVFGTHSIQEKPPFPEKRLPNGLSPSSSNFIDARFG